jgi:hypothetical protein
MNLQETKAFFMRLGWKLQSAPPDWELGRWDLIRKLGNGGELIYHFQSVEHLWTYWKTYTEQKALQGPVLDYLVTQYLLQDADIQASIWNWLIDGERANKFSKVRVREMWRKVAMIERDASVPLRRWRCRMEMLLSDPHANRRRAPEFMSRLKREMLIRANAIKQARLDVS